MTADRYTIITADVREGLGRVRLLQGDWITRLRELPAESVQCCVTSPPYLGCRDYQADGQLGLERSLEEYVEKLRVGFAEVRRVLRPDGTLFLNLGHKFNGSGGSGGDYEDDGMRAGQPKYGGFSYPGFQPKCLIPLAWYVVPALVRDGWILRADNIREKPQPSPNPARDRTVLAHEYVSMLTKQPAYYYDFLAVAEPASTNTHSRGKGVNPKAERQAHDGLCRQNPSFSGAMAGLAAIRNRRSIWRIPKDVTVDGHYATFPERLAELCILSGTSAHGACPECGAPWERQIEWRDTGQTQKTADGWDTSPGTHTAIHRRGAEKGKGGQSVLAPVTTGWQPTCSCGHEERVPCVVLDCFMGSGTTGAVARRLGRAFVGIELAEHYMRIAEERIGLAVHDRAPGDAEEREQLTMETLP